MLNNLIEFSLKYRLLVVIAFIAIFVFGIRAYNSISIDAFPDITPKQVVIYTESPGNSANDIEKLITYPIESALSGMAGVKNITSNSIFGLSYVSVFFEDDMDIYFLRELVIQRLNSVDIPSGWGKPTLGPNTTGLGQVFWYYIKDSSLKYSLSQLRSMQDFIVSPMLKSVSGVEEVVSWGGFNKQYNIILDTKKLQNIDITYDEIVQAVEDSNQVSGGQYLEFNSQQYLIGFNGMYKNLQDINNTIIKQIDSKAITLADVASIEVGTAPRFGAVSIDGSESVMAMVLQRSATNADQVVKNIKQKLPIINQTLPKGVSIEVLYDRTDITHKAISTMNSALISGITLVIIVLFLFLFELRTALIVVVSIPMSLLVAFLFMDYYSLSANLMSLSGLAIAVGMIVDGTIVVVENSYRNLNNNPNAPKLQIVLQSIKEVATPVVFAVLVIIAVFIPLLNLNGLAGKLYSPMALNIVFAMIGSLVVSLTLIPVLVLMFLKPSKNHESLIISKIKEFYSPKLDYVLLHSKIVLIGVSLIFLFLASLLVLEGREFMPKLNEESIMYRVIAIPGTALSQSIKSAKDIENHILKSYPDSIESVLSMIGRSEKGETAQANYMEILLILKDNIDNIPALTHTISEDLEHRFTHVGFVPTQPIAMRIEELLEGVQSELAIKIYGEDQKILANIAKQIQSSIKNIDGLSSFEPQSQLGQSQIKITPNYLSLARYGISVKSLMRVVKNGLGEESVSQMIEGVKRFDIAIKIKDAKKDISSIKNITIRTQTGAIITLQDLCKIEVVDGPSFIKRENLSRYLILGIEVEGRDVASFVKEADEIIKKSVDMPMGYYIGWAGEFKNMQEATDRLLIIIPITIATIVLLLYMAFNSVKKAMLILINVPFGFIGSIIALLISGIYLSVSAIIGFMAIFAIAILNGIVLVSFIDDLRVKYPDKELKKILKDATLLRLRPVLMTAFTTLFGILPLLYASGVGSEIQYPLAVVITGGIISSTILTLLILPSTYLMMFRRV